MDKGVCNLCNGKAKIVNWILTGKCDKCNFAYLQGIKDTLTLLRKYNYDIAFTPEEIEKRFAKSQEKEKGGKK